MKNRRLKLNLVIAASLIVVAVLGYLTPENRIAIWTGSLTGSEMTEHEAGKYMTVIDAQGTVITKIGRSVVPGDEIITARAEHYRITRVEGGVAEARLLGLDHDLLAWRDYYERHGGQAAVPAQGRGGTDVAVYHSHTMESYVPDSGTAFQERGDIIDVGRAFAGALRAQGLRVFHDTTNHNPHDAQAYERSRKTAVQLLERHNPSMLIDLHRDGVPDPDFYRRQIGGETVSQLRLVVGRQNPKQDANTDFARRLMARANERHPEVVKEIFKASGNYNQDLTSTALLIEAGTHTNTRAEAQNGLALLAEAVPVVLGTAGAGGPDQAGGLVGWRVALAIVVVVLAALAAYLVIGAGGLPQAGEKLNQFFTREFGLGRGERLKLRDGGDDERDRSEN